MICNLSHKDDINKTLWNKFIEQTSSGDLYHEYEYLSYIMPDWKALIVYEGTEILAVFPFEIKQKYFIKYALQPHFCQVLGIVFKNDLAANFQKSYDKKKEIIKLILTHFPKNVRVVKYHFQTDFDYLLPMIWAGWKYKPLFTNHLYLKTDLKELEKNLASHTRRDIKKAGEQNFVVENGNFYKEVIKLITTEKPEQAKKTGPFFLQALLNLGEYYSLKDKSTCYVVKNGEGMVICAIIYLFYKNKMTYFQGTVSKEYRNSGAMSLLIWQSIKDHYKTYEHLDFDGSSIESIDKFFRGFGSKPVQYHLLSKSRFPFNL